MGDDRLSIFILHSKMLRATNACLRKLRSGKSILILNDKLSSPCLTNFQLCGYWSSPLWLYKLQRIPPKTFGTFTLLGYYKRIIEQVGFNINICERGCVSLRQRVIYTSSLTISTITIPNLKWKKIFFSSELRLRLLQLCIIYVIRFKLSIQFSFIFYRDPAFV